MKLLAALDGDAEVFLGIVGPGGILVDFNVSTAERIDVFDADGDDPHVYISGSTQRPDERLTNRQR